MSCVKSIDIGWIGNVREDFCYDFDEEDKVEGCYRSLTQFLPFMASFYLNHKLQYDAFVSFRRSRGVTVGL